MPEFMRMAKSRMSRRSGRWTRMPCCAGRTHLLPEEIRVLSVEEVEPRVSRQAVRPRQNIRVPYVAAMPIVSPFHGRYVYAFRYPLDGERMDRGS